MKTLFPKRFSRFFLPLIALMAFISCQKDLSFDGATNPDPIADLTTRVNSSVSGFVTDENNAAVQGAPVSAGGVTVSTDKYGYFEIRNIQVVKNAAVVVVNKPGYFKGIKTYIADDNKSAFFRIKLIPKTLSGTIDGTAGGNVTLSNGLIIALPANAVVNAATNAAYGGTVNVAAHFIDPTSNELNMIMPGDLRGINTAGALKLLTSYGMAAVELTGTTGELLQIASGKKATLTMPIPAAIAGSAAASIPLWSFDENTGLWEEEGTATKNGNTYVGEVSHFSFWNCDVPNNYIRVSLTVKDQAGNPIPYALVTLSVVGNPYNAGYGITDSSGYVSGAAPPNTQFVMNIYTNYACGTPVYTQNISTTNVDLNLGTITIGVAVGLANISGTVTDCLSNPVTNGYVISLIDNHYYRHSINNTGAFNFNVALCNTSTNATFIAEDITGGQQSTPLSQTINTGANTIGNLQACGTSLQQFITYTVNGGAPVNFTYPTDTIVHSGSGTSSSAYIYGSRIQLGAPSDDINFSFGTTGISAGSTQPLQSFYASTLGTQTTIVPSINVNITEYGTVGQFISGNFTGQVTSGIPPGTTYNITCNFRVRRNF